MLITNRDGLPEGDTDNPVLIAAPRQGVPDVIDTPEALATAAAALETGTTPIALDVERAQGFRYGADPYLVQIRREDVGTFLIDTHALPDLTSLQTGVNDVWLLHNADQDLVNLRSTGLACPQLFDTEIAARMIGLTRFGLASVCEQILGLGLVKDHQASDWSVRPLPSDWLRYAALDVELMTELYRRLSVTLHDLGRWEWALEEFAYEAAKPAPEPKAERWRSLPGAGKIRSRRNLAVLRELWETREAIAEHIDLAPGRLVRNAALVRAALQPPRNRRTLMSLSEFRSPVARQHTDAWLRAISRALTMDEDAMPDKQKTPQPGSVPDARHWARLDEDAAARLGLVRDAVAGVADALNLAPEIVLEPKVQRYIAWAPLDPKRPSGDEVEERMYDRGARDWQMDLCLDPVCDALGV
ncbi:HRDC domain-containing protein [Schaalia vaccimaxillae]|uniref:HRDC domain-containing protein n=1 Tax=Schaalia vaccimaxillae TaxID=183916 RepID=UPI0003B6907C|nr:HRDC domain-containing protein [Schaalia vaccimaxillae]